MAFAGITFLHIVLGELAPKSLALLHPERVSRWAAPPLLLFTHVFWPAIWLLNKSAAGFLHLFAVRPPAHAERVHDPAELLLLLSESRKHGLVEESNAEMIAGVFDLAHISVRQAMTPRTDMEAVAHNWPLDKVIEVIRRSGYSRLPVYEEDLDHIIGILLSKDLLEFFDAQTPFSVDAIMREPFFIPETMRVDLLMKALQERNAHLAIVVDDEYGGTLGLVTLEDLIEEIVGDIFDKVDQNQMAASVQTTAEGRLSVPGDMPITELNQRYQLSFPEDDYVTVAGLVLAALEHVPTVGEQVQVQGVTWRVTKMDHLRIERLEITLRPAQRASNPPSAAPGYCVGLITPPVWRGGKARAGGGALRLETARELTLSALGKVAEVGLQGGPGLVQSWQLSRSLHLLGTPDELVTDLPLQGGLAGLLISPGKRGERLQMPGFGEQTVLRQGDRLVGMAETTLQFKKEVREKYPSAHGSLHLSPQCAALPGP